MPIALYNFQTRRRMQVAIEGQDLAAQSRAWFALPRRARREGSWAPLVQGLFAYLFPDIEWDQLLIGESDLFENFQLLLSSACSLHVKPLPGELSESSVSDLLVLLQGKLSYQLPLGRWGELRAGQTLPLPIAGGKNERTQVRVESASVYLRCERKAVEKFRNDTLRLDRDNKENFLSDFLFCGFTPVYAQNHVRVGRAKEGTAVAVGDALMVLHDGLVRRGSGPGSQLTKGCILSVKLLAGLVGQAGWFEQEPQLEAKLNCTLLTFDTEEMLRILKLNPGMKQLLQTKLQVISQERGQLRLKAQQLHAKFTERFKLESEALQIHYSISFRAKPRSATPRSFRRKGQGEGGQCSEFITYDRYEKMLASKEKVVVAKQRFQGHTITRIPTCSQGSDYQRRLKLQSKMLKIQTGKIQKISQRDSRTECHSQQMQDIKKNLFQITNLFDDPLPDPPPPHPTRTCNNLEHTEQRNTRISHLKPEDFLKNEYLHQFLSKSRTRYSLKDLGVEKKESNKDNKDNKENRENKEEKTLQRSEGFGVLKKTKNMKITFNQIIA